MYFVYKFRVADTVAQEIAHWSRISL